MNKGSLNYTVRDIIEFLQGYPLDADITIYDDNFGAFVTIDNEDILEDYLGYREQKNELP